MQLVFHAGAHFTEEDRLIKCLLRNQDALAGKGVVVPGPSKYRKLLRKTLSVPNDAVFAADARDVLLDAILDNAGADRVILSNAHLFGVPRAAQRRGMLYPQAPERMARLAQIFRTDQLELFMAVRDPATFLPACFRKSPHDTLADFMRGIDPRQVRWSDTFARIREAAPEVPVTVWCNEDAPLLWSQIVRELGVMEHGDFVIGGFDLLSDIISDEGMRRFVDYIKSKSKMSEIQVRRVMMAFMEKFALEQAIEEEIDVPGWTGDMITELSELYDEDMATLARIPGVTLISP
ncbi:MAG: hypothetical protein AAF665_01895 [Pseudomonadota bacterium]